MHRHTHWIIRAVALVSVLTLLSIGALGASAISAESTDESNQVVSLEHTSTVSPDGEFEITIETRESAGTVLEIDPDGFDIEMSTEADDAVRVDDQRVELLDVSAGDSTYTIDVDIIGGTDGDIAETAAWVNAETQADADDEAIDSFEIVTAGGGDDTEDSSGGSDTTSPGDDNDDSGEGTEFADEDSDEAESADEDSDEAESADEDSDEAESADEDSDETDDAIPGFGVPVAVGAMIVLTVLARRRYQPVCST